MAQERVQKILAQAGIASRRKSEELIQFGDVTINGKTAKLGDKAEWGKDAIKVRGKLLKAPEAHVYLAFHKPRLVISALNDPEGRPALGAYLLKVRERVYPVGRLDFNSEGLLLLTNDGDLAEQIQKSPEIGRLYELKLRGHPAPEDIERLRRGARIQGRVFKPKVVRLSKELASKTKIEILVQGAGAIDLRSYCELKGLLVDRIVRTAIGQIQLEGIRPGEYRILKKSQFQALVNQPELGLKLLEESERPAPAPESHRAETKHFIQRRHQR